MRAGFTPEPWSVRGLNIYADQRIATGSFLSRGSREQDVAESTANAHLIAAAPALYEALQAARAIIVEDANACRAFRDESEGPSGPENVLAKIDAVLAQARGDLVDPLEQVTP